MIINVINIFFIKHTTLLFFFRPVTLNVKCPVILKKNYYKVAFVLLKCCS